MPNRDTLPNGSTNGALTLEQLLATAVDDPVTADDLSDLQTSYEPAAGRVAEATGTGTYYLGDGSSWIVSDDVAFSLKTSGQTPTDVTALSSPSQGDTAYHDGSGGNTEGPAFYDGSQWVSTVDGTTIS